MTEKKGTESGINSSALHFKLEVHKPKELPFIYDSYASTDWGGLVCGLITQYDPFQDHKPCTLQMVSAQLPCLYRVIDQHTKAIIKSNLSLRAAYRLCDRLDMQYGATRYFSQRME